MTASVVARASLRFVAPGRTMSTRGLGPPRKLPTTRRCPSVDAILLPSILIEQLPCSVLVIVRTVLANAM